ncbi:hypothetical protein NL108_015160 [Boleophthalmus pectinirostris]|nr:hypothetical protein NL108_015160 [Boleophthalmus pectinirostris]
MDQSGGTVETLDEVPPHMWAGLPGYLSLGHSAVNQNRIGVWTTRLIPKDRRFGPFVGEKKKRSQVTSNVYMWEVYFPSRGWMCVDATDPLKGNWLRYVNWARSREEQNLFPVEINRAIYYKALRPIGPGEELLVWYSVQDNPEVTAAIEEERANRKNSPRAKRASPAGLGGFNKTSTTEPSAKEMWDGDEGVNEEDQRPSIEIQEANEIASMNYGEVERVMSDRGNGREEEEEQMEEDGDELEEDVQQKDAQYSFVQEQPRQSVTSADTNKESHSFNTESTHSGHNADIDPDYDPDLEGDPQGSYPCHQCERHFSTKQGLERHLHIHATSNQPPQVFKCRYCSKAFSSQVGRRRHERRHENGFKKKTGSLAGTPNLLSNVAQTNASSSDFTNLTSHYTAIGTQLTGAVVHNMDMQKKEVIVDRPFVMDENGESKELHPCKYCNKAFGTHTNMRRHQRRIHERHLLPKGVRRKGMLLQEAQQLPDESPSASPPPVYLPSADTEDETDRDDYAVDISKNISDNLNYYIDGKIVSTNAASGCDVIEVDSRSAALFGLDTVIISPSQLTPTLKVEPRMSTTKQVSNLGQSTGKRRTSTPPLVPNLKVETETQSLTVCPPSSSSSSSSSSLLVGGLFQQDTSSFQREKTVYLSPKLKQLLQTQDMQKSTIAVLTESHRLTSVTPIQGTSGRFKRRTASPPASPQLSPPGKVEKSEVFSPYLLKVPKLESQSVSLVPCSMNDKKDGEPLENTTQEHSSSNSGGNTCNQQPLDLSNSYTRKSDSGIKVLGDGALDLSCHRKNSIEPELKGSPGPQPLVKKRKPNTSMLEKVLMNEYVGLPLPGEESPSALANVIPSRSPNVTSDSGNPSPPSLTPVTLNPSSPMGDGVTSPTPPPPVLPTIPSPPPMPSSPLSQPSELTELRPLPVLSPKISPSSPNLSVDHEPTSQDASAAVETTTSLLNGKIESNTETVEEKSPSLDNADSSPKESTTSSPAPASPKSPSPKLKISDHIQIKEEAQNGVDENPVPNHVPEDKVDANDDSDKTAEGENDLDYCKTFVCNVCEEPFDSIKELSGHIAVHAEEWPFKCEFCVQLFTDGPGLLEHRSTLHGVGTIYVCSVCSKEFAFLCNLEQHQQDLHPQMTCTHTTVESGKLRPQNYTDPTRAKDESSPSTPAKEQAEEVPINNESEKEETDMNGNHTQKEGEDPNEELYTTIKIMASEGGKPKGPDVRLGINQHYPSFKPPPFPYHSRSHASVASATNFTTHNIPQTFSTAIRCTKCGNSFDNMPELHQHILACANASDKKRYTPKKNPIPLKQIVKSPNGVVSPTAAGAGQGAFRRMGQPKRLNFNVETGKMKMNALSKKKNQLVQKAISQKNKSATNSKTSPVKTEEEQDSPSANICPHCSREFTYAASLSKHCVNCPMKPAGKKGKKTAAEVKKEPTPATDKSMSLRKKNADPEPAQTEAETKPLGKTRARSSGAAEPEPTPTIKAKGGPGRPKRPASFPESKSPPTKKAKKGSPQSAPVAPADTPSDPAPKPASKTQPKGKEAPPKKPAESKSPSVKKERFSLRSRTGGPITRSSQATAASAPGQAEEQASEESKDTQVR